jgi:hypothetical protein
VIDLSAKSIGCPVDGLQVNLPLCCLATSSTGEGWQKGSDLDNFVDELGRMAGQIVP